MLFFRLAGGFAVVLALFVGVRSVDWFPPEEMLTVWVNGSPQEAQLYRRIADQYSRENPEVRFRLEVVPGRNVVQKLLTGMDAGHAPDICVLHWRTMAQVASTGQLLPIDDLVRRDKVDVDDYYPVGLQAYRYNGQLFGLPVKGSTITCFYNKALFDEYGVEYPTSDWTWDEMLEKAQMLTVDIDQDEEGRTRVQEVNGGKQIIPTIVFQDGSILVEPSNA